MAKKRSGKRGRRVPKTALRLPDLGQAKSAVLNSLSSTDAQRGYPRGESLDPFAYLRDVFERIAAHPKSRLDELLPDKWAAARSGTTS